MKSISKSKGMKGSANDHFRPRVFLPDQRHDLTSLAFVHRIHIKNLASRKLFRHFLYVLSQALVKVEWSA